MRAGYLIAIFFLASCCQNYRVENLINEFEAGSRGVELTNRQLEEISGLAASRTNSGFLWAHNDSGGKPEIYLLDETLTIKLTVELIGVVNRDWEDIALAPGADGRSYIYLGEIGDNEGRYDVKYIYKFPEPILGDTNRVQVTPERIAFKMEGKARDAEALMVHPQTNEIFVVSKREDRVGVYSLGNPVPSTDTVKAIRKIELPLTQIVAADISPDGKEIIMKNYGHIYYWKQAKKEGLIKMLEQKPHEILYRIEPQGESIAWSVTGSGFYTISELNPGKSSYLYFYPRKKAAPTK